MTLNKKYLTKNEAYEKCKCKMEYAAGRIRSVALGMGMGFYPEMCRPVGPHGGWTQEHQYWLHCMHVTEKASKEDRFDIDENYLYIIKNNEREKVYNH